MFHARTFALLATSTVASSLLIGVQPAAAAPPALPAPAGLTALLAADPAEPEDRYRIQVRRLADKDPRWEVSTAASSALVQDKKYPEENIARDFLLPGGGYEAARKRATTNAARNDLIISRAIATSTPMTSPYVNMTAKRAAVGSLAEKDRYVRTGLAEAQALDAKHAPIVAAQKQDELDRRYVADLAENASGAWVKAAAARAVELGTDAAIAEFFKYGWNSGAACDLQAYRMELIEQQLYYRNELNKLIVKAEEATAAIKGVEEAAKAKAVEEAKSAWHLAAATAAATQDTWNANQKLAREQAAMWQSVHDFAVDASTKQDWPGIAAKATATSNSWADELAWAQEQAQIWTDLAQDARDSAEAIPTPGTPTPPPAA